MRIDILTPGFTTPNGRAFLFPLVVHRRALAERGLELRFVAGADRVRDADAVIVDSKFHRDRWASDGEGVLREFETLKGRAGRLFYFDTSDSSGWLMSTLLPLVDGYGKAQVLRDRRRYLSPIYGHRLHADFAHRQFGIEDDTPEVSTPVSDPTLLAKIFVTWNSGLADYSPLGPLRMALRRRVPLDPLLRYPEPVASPSRPRPSPVSCRFGVDYPRASVAWQRRRVREMMGAQYDTTKLPRRAYFRELETSRIVISPFGFGEITLKDFETFLTGGLLLKPDMAHLETWPDLFRVDETMATHRWDCADLEDRTAALLADAPHARRLAEAGQDTYRRFTASAEAGGRFADHVAAIFAPAPVFRATPASVATC